LSNSKRFMKMLAKNVKQSIGPGEYEAQGIKVVCPHCKHDKFITGGAQLNTAFLTFLKLDFVNRTAHTLTCECCGRIEWFVKDVKRIYK